MNLRQKAELFLLALVATLVYLNYNPYDDKAGWILYATLWIFLAFGYLVDMMFCQDMLFVYDPNPENWRRKVDPQS
jgi:hypothetical protein